MEHSCEGSGVCANLCTVCSIAFRNAGVPVECLLVCVCGCVHMCEHGLHFMHGILNMRVGVFMFVCTCTATITSPRCVKAASVQGDREAVVAKLALLPSTAVPAGSGSSTFCTKAALAGIAKKHCIVNAALAKLCFSLFIQRVCTVMPPEAAL